MASNDQNIPEVLASKFRDIEKIMVLSTLPITTGCVLSVNCEVNWRNARFYACTERKTQPSVWREGRYSC